MVRIHGSTTVLFALVAFTILGTLTNIGHAGGGDDDDDDDVGCFSIKGLPISCSPAPAGATRTRTGSQSSSESSTATTTGTHTTSLTASETSTMSSTSSRTQTSTMTASPSESPTGTHSATGTTPSSMTSTNTVSASESSSSSMSATHTLSSSNSLSASGSGTPMQSASGLSTPSSFPSDIPSSFPTKTGTGSGTLSHTETPTASLSPSSTPENETQSSVTPTASGACVGTSTSTSSATRTYSPSSTETSTVSPSQTETQSNSGSHNLSPSKSVTVSPSTSVLVGSPSQSLTGTPSLTDVPTSTSSETGSATSTRSPTSTESVTSSSSGTQSVSASQSSAAAESLSPTATLSSTHTTSISATHSTTETSSLTASSSLSSASTGTGTSSVSGTASPSSPGTSSPLPSDSSTTSPSTSGTISASGSGSSTPSSSVSRSRSVSGTVTGTTSPSSSASATESESFSSSSSVSPTSTSSVSVSETQTSSATLSASPSDTASPSISMTPTPSATFACPAGTYMDGNSCPACPGNTTSKYPGRTIDDCYCVEGYGLSASGLCRLIQLERCVDAAVIDFYAIVKKHRHILNVDDGFQKFVRNDTRGVIYQEFDDGSARMYGLLVNRDTTGSYLEMNVYFTGCYDSASSPLNNGISPFQYLSPFAYVQLGGPIDQTLWHYYAIGTGDFVGGGKLAGMSASNLTTEVPWQVGYGANNRNSKFGGQWTFNWVRSGTAADPSQNWGTTGTAEFNVNLGECPPLPSSLPTPSHTPTRTPPSTRSSTVSSSRTASVTTSTSISPSMTRSRTATTTDSSSSSQTVTTTASGTASVSVSPSISSTTSSTAAPTLSPTTTSTVSASGSLTSSTSASPTITGSSTTTETPSSSLSASCSISTSVTSSVSATLSSTVSTSPSESSTPSGSPSETLTPSSSVSVSPSPTTTTSVSSTSEPTPTPTATDATDRTPPVISLLGLNPIAMNLGDIFVEPGVDVTDNVDLPQNIAVFFDISALNTSQAGPYRISYTAIDTSGNVAISHRDVIVLDSRPSAIRITRFDNVRENVVHIQFSRPTNMPPVSDNSSETLLFVPSLESIGVEEAEFKWQSPTVMYMSVIRVDPSLFVDPVTTGLVLYVREQLGLRGANEERGASTPVSGPLSGSRWKRPKGPRVVGVYAVDPDNGDAVYGVGDCLRVQFDRDTNRGDQANITFDPPVARTFYYEGEPSSTEDVMGLINPSNLSSLLLSSTTRYHVQDIPLSDRGGLFWVDSRNVLLCIKTPVDPVPTSLETFHRFSFNMRIHTSSIYDTSQASYAVEDELFHGTLTGTWGKVRGPRIKDLSCSDPDDGDRVYSKDDRWTLRFDIPTNRPAVKSKRDIDRFLRFYKRAPRSSFSSTAYTAQMQPTTVILDNDQQLTSISIGMAYSGRWVDASTLEITVSKLDEAAALDYPDPGQVVAVPVGTQLLDEDEESLTSEEGLLLDKIENVVAGSANLTGSWGRLGPQIVEVEPVDEDEDLVLTDGDYLKIKFDIDTNMPNVSSTEQLRSLVSIPAIENLPDTVIRAWWNSSSVLVVQLFNINETDVQTSLRSYNAYLEVSLRNSSGLTDASGELNKTEDSKVLLQVDEVMGPVFPGFSDITPTDTKSCRGFRGWFRCYWYIPFVLLGILQAYLAHVYWHSRKDFDMVHGVWTSKPRKGVIADDVDGDAGVFWTKFKHTLSQGYAEPIKINCGSPTKVDEPAVRRRTMARLPNLTRIVPHS